MIGLKPHIFFLLLVLLVAAGCNANARLKQVERPDWEPATAELSPPPGFQLPVSTEPAAMPPAPFDASDFARELSKLSSEAAAEVAKLKTEAEIETSFPDEASAMLEDMAKSLRMAAEGGYDSLEAELEEAYKSYALGIGKLEDNIRLGESMEYVYGRDMVGYYQLNSTKINEMKKAYWNEKLERLGAELAAERATFRFVKEAKLLARASEISANQRGIIDSLEDQLKVLAMDYAERVKQAISEAAETAGTIPAPPEFPVAGLASRTEDFDTEFKKRFEKAKVITGG
jgi:hypothetical protein